MLNKNSYGIMLHRMFPSIDKEKFTRPTPESIVIGQVWSRHEISHVPLN